MNLLLKRQVRLQTQLLLSANEVSLYTCTTFYELNVRGSYFHAWRVCYALVLLIGTLALDLLHSLDNVFGLPNHTARQRQD